jgi:hypothetical protein
MRLGFPSPGRLARSRPLHETMHIDRPYTGDVCIQPFILSGWAVDAEGDAITPTDAVYVYAKSLRRPARAGQRTVATSFVSSHADSAPRTYAGSAVCGLARPDLEELFGPEFASSGFGIRLRGLRAGPYLLSLYARSAKTGRLSQMRAISIEIEANPQLMIDSPGHGAAVGGAFEVQGWAADLASSGGPGIRRVHVWTQSTRRMARRRWIGEARYGMARRDVASVHGEQFRASGFGIPVVGLDRGQHRLIVELETELGDRLDQSILIRVT